MISLDDFFVEHSFKGWAVSLFLFVPLVIAIFVICLTMAVVTDLAMWAERKWRVRIFPKSWESRQ